MANVTHDLGYVTAYGAALQGGYEGTYEEFCAQQAGYAETAAAVLAARDEAVAAATAAGTSETNAATSETNAAASAANAASSETNAANSATEANNYTRTASRAALTASTYKDQAEAAATSAQNTAAAVNAAVELCTSSAATASTNATNATAAATSAQGSATAASNSAANAETFKNSAANSESNAADSATAAAGSATNAAGSATAATESATAASTSEGNASASATNAAASATAAAASAAEAAESALTLVVDPTLTVSGRAADAKATGDAIYKYDDVQRIVEIIDASITLGSVATLLNSINVAGDHVFFDVSALGVQMYLCTIFIDTDEGIYKIVDLVRGREAEGSYDAEMLLTMAIATASDLATQSQVDYLQGEIDELAGRAVFTDFEALGNAIADGTSEQLITPGDTIDINWIKTVLGTTTYGLTVTCSDMDVFVNGVGEAEAKTYLFVYDGTSWTLDGTAVNLANFGLSLSGAPATGEVMTIVTTVTTVSFTFTSYDTAQASDSAVPHNWLLEETFAPSTKVFDTNEALFAVYQGKTIPAGNYHVRCRSYMNSMYVDIYITVAEAIGSANYIVQLCSTGYTKRDIENADGVAKSNIYTITNITPRIYGTRTAAGGALTFSHAPTEGVSYTELADLNVDANDPVVYLGEGVYDKCVFGSNTWPMSNLRSWLNDATGAKDSATPSHMLDAVSAYQLGAGNLWGLDPRVKSLIQFCSARWTAGYGNDHAVGAYAIATGTAPSSDAPTYYSKSGSPGAWVYTALDPQPAAGESVEGYYVFTDVYSQGKVYESDDKVFLLSMKEMAFNIQTAEGVMTELYGDYTNGALTNDAVADRAKYNKAGGTKNSYRWGRSALSSYANHVRFVSSSGSNNSNNAVNANYYARAFILGKSTNQ